MRTSEIVNREYTNTLTLAGDKTYRARLLTLEAETLYKQADALNTEAGEIKKKVSAESPTSDELSVTPEVVQDAIESQPDDAA